MSNENKKLISPIMDAILAAFKKEYEAKGYYIGDYDEDDENLKPPAILIQLSGFENAESSIPGVFRANCTFCAYICESFKGNAKARVRDTSLEVAYFVDGNFWGDLNTFTKAKFELAEEDPFNEKLDNAEIWRVEWRQEIYLEK